MRFTEILTQLGIPFRDEGHEHCRTNWVQLDCPWCSRGWQHYRMGYNLSKGYLNCWNCGYHGVAQTLVELSGNSFRDVKELLSGLELESFAAVRKTGTLKLPSGVGELRTAHRKYLKGRGFDPEQLQKLWGIQGIAQDGDYPWSLFIPIHARGEVVSWTTRRVSDDHGRRYRSASPEQEAVSHKRLLYGEDYCRHAVVIVEGPTDVWRIGPGAAATCGTGFTRAQVLAASKYLTRVVVFDNDAGARVRADQLCEQLEGFPGRTYNVLLSGKDACESPDREIRQLRKRFLEGVTS